MLNSERLRSLSELSAPLLTVYLDTAPVKASQHAPVPRYLTWLKNEAKTVIRSVLSGELNLFREQLHRVEEFLEGRIPRGKGLAIFAGPATWETETLQVEIANELHWGKPALSQLHWLAAAHKPCCIVVVDHGGARFFGYWLGEMAKVKETVFEVDVSQWKKKDLGHVTRPGVRMAYGSQRDVFEHRMEAQYEQFCRETAEQANHLRENEGFEAIFLAGPERLIEPIEREFPQEVRQRVVLIRKDLGKLETHELQERLEPEIEKWECERGSALVSDLLSSKRSAVVGIDETLAQLQAGKTRSLLLAHDFDAELHQCKLCGWTDRSADPVCPVCKGERRQIKLRDALSDLALRFEAHIEVVSGEAAERLTDAGGIGAWLAQEKQGRLRRVGDAGQRSTAGR